MRARTEGDPAPPQRQPAPPATHPSQKLVLGVQASPPGPPRMLWLLFLTLPCLGGSVPVTPGESCPHQCPKAPGPSCSQGQPPAGRGHPLLRSFPSP